jgi:hypothetical protein
MAKHTRQLPARPKPNRLVLELLEDRSLPSGTAGACDPPLTAQHGPAVAWDAPRGGYDPAADARPAAFAPGRDSPGMTPPDRAPTWGGWQDIRPDRPTFYDPGAFGRAPALPVFAPPAAGAPAVVEWVVVTTEVVVPDPSTTVTAVRTADSPGADHEPSNPVTATAEVKGEQVRASIGKPATLPDTVDRGVGLILANFHGTAVNLDPPSPAVVALAGRLAPAGAAPELLRAGELTSQFATAGARSGDGRGAFALADVQRPDAPLAERIPVRGSAGGFADAVAVPLTPPTAAGMSGEARVEHAGLLPLDPGALAQGVQQFFRRLGGLGREAKGEPAWARLAPWFVVVVGIGFGVEWVRRLPRSAPAPDPAEPPRRGLAWRWSDEFASPVPLDAP